MVFIYIDGIWFWVSIYSTGRKFSSSLDLLVFKNRMEKRENHGTSSMPAGPGSQRSLDVVPENEKIEKELRECLNLGNCLHLCDRKEEETPDWERKAGSGKAKTASD